MNPSWSDLGDMHRDYHPSMEGVGTNLFYYDPWSRLKVSAATEHRLVGGSLVVTGSIQGGWDHLQEDAL